MATPIDILRFLDPCVQYLEEEGYLFRLNGNISIHRGSGQVVYLRHDRGVQYVLRFCKETNCFIRCQQSEMATAYCFIDGDTLSFEFSSSCAGEYPLASKLSFQRPTALTILEKAMRDYLESEESKCADSFERNNLVKLALQTFSISNTSVFPKKKILSTHYER